MSLINAIAEVEKEEKALTGGKDAALEEKQGTKEKEDGKVQPEAQSVDADDNGRVAESADNVDVARLRREAAANKKRAEEAEARLKQAPAAKPAEAKPPVNADAEPDPNTDPEAHLRWELRQANTKLQSLTEWRQAEEAKYQQKELRENAVRAYTGYEDTFKATVPDYEAVASFGVQAITASIRTLRPDLTGEALTEAVRTQILRSAGAAEAQGYNPVEHFYHQAMSWGYKPKEAPAPAAAEDAGKDEKLKPSLKSIVDSKRKSVSSMTPGGKNGKIPLSREAILDKSFGLQDFARLTPEQLKEMEAM